MDNTKREGSLQATLSNTFALTEEDDLTVLALR